jgi:hypothetical protein
MFSLNNLSRPLFATTLVVVLSLGTGAMARSVKKDAITPAPTAAADKVKKEAAEAVHASKEYASLKKEEYEGRLKKDLAEVDAQIIRLRERLKTEGKESKEKLKEHISKLEDERDEVRSEFKKLSNQSGKAWDDIRQGFEHAFSGLKKSMKSATSRFKD